MSEQINKYTELHEEFIDGLFEYYKTYETFMGNPSVFQIKRLRKSIKIMHKILKIMEKAAQECRSDRPNWVDPRKSYKLPKGKEND